MMQLANYKTKKNKGTQEIWTSEDLRTWESDEDLITRGPGDLRTKGSEDQRIWKSKDMWIKDPSFKGTEDLRI